MGPLRASSTECLEFWVSCKLLVQATCTLPLCIGQDENAKIALNTRMLRRSAVGQIGEAVSSAATEREPPGGGAHSAQPKGQDQRLRGISIRNSELRSIVLVGDTLAAAFAAWLGPELWAAVDPSFSRNPSVGYWQVTSIALWVVALRIAGAGYANSPRLTRRSLLTVVQALLGMTILVLTLFYVSPFFAPRGSTLISLPLATATIMLWRFLCARLLRIRALEVNVAIVGIDAGAQRTAKVLLDSKGSSYHVCAFVAPVDDVSPIHGIEVIGVREDLWSTVQALDVEQLVIGNTQKLPPSLLNELVRCFDHGVEAIPATKIYEDISGRVLASALEADWYAGLPTHTRGLYMGVRRLVDLVFGAVMLVVMLPLMAIVGVIVWLDSGRPVLLRQVRIGMRGKPFVMHKFRTMRTDAEAGGSAIWASQNDQRVTRAGRVLRRSRLDELPQLWDVMRGAMSLIGPRPERPEFVERLAAELPLYRARILVRPGITGWAQVEFPYAGSVADNLTKLEYDLFYIRHIGPLLDLTIAIRTLFIVLRMRGR